MKVSQMPLGAVDFHALIVQAEAYEDAVQALFEISGGAPLSTTIGYMIRQGHLVFAPAHLVFAPAPLAADLRGAGQ